MQIKEKTTSGVDIITTWFSTTRKRVLKIKQNQYEDIEYLVLRNKEWFQFRKKGYSRKVRGAYFWATGFDYGYLSHRIDGPTYIHISSGFKAWNIKNCDLKEENYWNW